MTRKTREAHDAEYWGHRRRDEPVSFDTPPLPSAAALWVVLAAGVTFGAVVAGWLW